MYKQLSVLQCWSKNQFIIQFNLTSKKVTNITSIICFTSGVSHQLDISQPLLLLLRKFISTEIQICFSLWLTYCLMKKKSGEHLCLCLTLSSPYGPCLHLLKSIIKPLLILFVHDPHSRGKCHHDIDIGDFCGVLFWTHWSSDLI